MRNEDNIFMFENNGYTRATRGAFFRVPWFLFRARPDDAGRHSLQREATQLWMKKPCRCYECYEQALQVARVYTHWKTISRFIEYAL